LLWAEKRPKEMGEVNRAPVTSHPFSPHEAARCHDPTRLK
jgi:hypothetical protein